MAFLRAIGEVRRVEIKRGSTSTGDYAFPVVRILSSDADITEVTLAKELPTPSVGDHVDYGCAVYVTRNGALRINAQEAYAVPHEMKAAG
jgi:hypothetical protein